MLRSDSKDGGHCEFGSGVEEVEGGSDWYKLELIDVEE